MNTVLRTNNTVKDKPISCACLDPTHNMTTPPSPCFHVHIYLENFQKFHNGQKKINLIKALASSLIMKNQDKKVLNLISMTFLLVCALTLNIFQ